VLSFQMPSITSYMVFESFHRSHISYHNIGVHVLVYLVLPQVDVLDTPFDAYACLLASFFITRHVHVLRGVIFHNQPNTQNISCRIILAMNSDCIAHEPYTFHFCLVCASSYIHLLSSYDQRLYSVRCYMQWCKTTSGLFGHRFICFCHEGFGLGESTVKVSSTDTSGPTRSPYGHIWAHSGHILGHLGPILGPMFGPFGSIWANFRWALGLLWAYYGPILHP
jgi:hypothetical protein